MKKKIVVVSAVPILILTLLVLILGSALFWRESLHIADLKVFTEMAEEKEARHLENLNKFIENYNELYSSYNELYSNYQELANEKGYWDKFLVTAYNANDSQQGTNNITSIGINLDKDWTKYFNLCAVDPEVIPYGSILAIRFSDGDVRYFLAVDCGEAIRGKHIDILYMNKDRAIEFGKRELEVKVLK